MICTTLCFVDVDDYKLPENFSKCLYAVSLFVPSITQGSMTIRASDLYIQDNSSGVSIATPKRRFRYAVLS